MSILAFNSGSSTLKFALFEEGSGRLNPLGMGMVSAFGPEARLEWELGGAHGERRVSTEGHYEAAGRVLDWMRGCFAEAAPTAVGHRVVHGGELFSAPVRITDEVLAKIEALSTLAPLHNPAAAAAIRACRAHLGVQMPMVAVFDTAFFRGLPQHARRYALPASWSRDYGIQRFGFHGIAHRYLYQRAAEISGADPKACRVITLQLGHGCSIAAVRGDEVLDTSMGFTPLEGLVMATRCGDVDPGVLLHLAAQGLTPQELDEGLNHRAGLLGLSGASSDMRELLRLEAEGHAGAALAVQTFCHRARKYLGAYLAVLGGADAIVFGGGIGEHAAPVRARICAGMQWCGLVLDEAANQAAAGVEECISAPQSPVAAYVIPVNEELLIARDTLECLKSGSTGKA